MGSNMCMELATSSGHLGMKLECPFQKNFEIFSRRIDKHSKIKQRRPGSWFSTNARNAKFAAAPSLRMESNGYLGRKNYTQSNDKIYERLDSCLVIPPPNGKKPRAIVKFLGGAFIGAVPEATYGYLLELLANEGYLIISVPYNVTFDHAQAAKEIYERFNACYDRISTSGLPGANLTATEFLHLPLYSVGHSNGALLQALTGSYFSEKIPEANAIISYNNRPATEAVPYFEQVKNPQQDLPMGIGIALSSCCILYMLVSAVIVGLVPYYALDPDTPISSAFAHYGMEWAAYVITIGALTALCSGVIGGILPQPRILMAMARDGLLPSFFSDINKHTKVPVKSTMVTGISAAALASLLDIEQLAGMVSVGTLLAFTTVAISILILRYVPPEEAPFPSSLQDSIHAEIVSCSSSTGTDGEKTKGSIGSCEHLLDNEESLAGHPLIEKAAQDELNELRRRKIASWGIAGVCTGALLLASAASAKYLPEIPRFILCGVGVVLLSCGLIVLTCIDQGDAWHSFGHPGGFTCPLVPLLPVCCILINTYLLINLGSGTWIRASMWLVVGAFVYVFYGRSHSLLLHTTI